MIFSEKLLRWFDQHGRHDLPWQQDINPYRVWVSEIMLQQTQVKTVIPYYQRFMQRYPHVEELANSEQDEVLHYWTGLGYYARARNLHKAAQQIRDEYHGLFPQDFNAVLGLPGIGRSTAGAILSIACGQRHAILDGNVKRVLTRYYAIEGWPGDSKVADKLWQLADELTPARRVADYNQAMMDLGATLCRRGKPDCERCAVANECQAYQQQQVARFPYSKPKKEKPVRNTCFLILVNQSQQILMQQRPANGIWGGLWSFPEREAQINRADFLDQLKHQYDFTAKDTLTRPTIRHTFTHFHLDIEIQLIHGVLKAGKVTEESGQIWQDQPLKQNLGFPAPVKRLLEQLSNEEILNDTNGSVRKAG